MGDRDAVSDGYLVDVQADWSVCWLVSCRPLPVLNCPCTLEHSRTSLRMHRLIESHRAELRALAHQYGIPSIKVFGSMARDDADDDSDVDLLVEASPETSGFTLGALLMDIEDLLHRRVDIVTPSALHPALRERVLQEARPL